MMRLYLVVLLSLSFVLSMGPETVFAQGADAPPDDMAEPEPEAVTTVDDLLARTTPALPPMAFGVKDGYLRATVPARLFGEPEASDEMHYVAFDLGGATTSPVECWIYHQSRDLAGTLHKLSGSVLRAFDHLGQPEVMAVRDFGMEVRDRYALAAVDWILRFATEKGPIFSQIEIIHARSWDRSIACSHAEIGYQESFERVVMAFLDSVEYGPEEKRPFFEEISLLGTEDMGFAIVHEGLELTPEGGIRETGYQSLATPGNEGQLRTFDSVLVSLADRDGSLRASTYIEGEGGELKTRLDLRPVDVGGWSIQGNHHDRGEVAARLDPEPLRSLHGQRMDFRAWQKDAKPGDVFERIVWAPDHEPAAWSTNRLTFESRDAVGIHLDYDLPDIHLKAHVDENLGMLLGRDAEPGSPVIVRRLYLAGSPSLPETP